MSGPVGLARLTQGALSTSEITASSLANVAPVMSFMFSFAVIEQGAGLASGITVVLVAIAIFFHANSISQMSKKLPSSGSYITYLGTAFGPVVGTATAVLVAFGYIVSTAGLMVIVGGWSSTILEKFLNIPLPWEPITLLFVAFLAYLMINGVKISTKWLISAFLFEMIVLGVVLALIFIKDHSFISFAAFNPKDVKGGLAGIGLGFPIAIWMFTGVGNSMGLAEDTKNPRKDIPRAIFIALGFAAVIYIVLSWANTIGLHNNAKSIASSPIPLVTVGAAVLGPATIFIYLAGLTSTFAEIIGATNGQSRMLFSAGRDGLLPPFLGKTNKHRSPWTALSVYLVVGLIIGISWGWIGHVNPIVLFGYLGSLAGIPIALIYTFVNLAVPIFYFRFYKSDFRILEHLILPTLGILAMVLPIWGLVQPGQVFPFNYFPLIGLIVTLLGVAYGFRVTRRRPYVKDRVGKILADDDVIQV